MKNQKVSIIIPVYNGSNYLREAIDSALAQTYPNCEIIVVNDGSDDKGATEAIAMSYGSRIRYYNKENGGVATALNLAITKMEGVYFSWLSHDDMYCKNKIEFQMNTLQARNVKEQIVYCNIQILDEFTNLMKTSRLEEKYPKKQLEKGIFLPWMGGMHGCSLLIHKSHFERVGLFDEKLKTIQDYDMWFRMLSGQKLIFLSEALIISRNHPMQGSKTDNRCLMENEELYIKKLREFDENEIINVFGSEYKFYSDLLYKFYKMKLEGCFHEVRLRLQNCIQPKEAEGEIRKLIQEMYIMLGKNCLKLCIFGAGIRGKSLLYRFRGRGIDVFAFIDNSQTKQGTLIEGIPCIAASQIEKETMGIIISIKEPEETLQQLEQMGIKYVTTQDDIEEELFRTVVLQKYV